ncbi:hypothetical protein D3C80_725680 [compost metagenome]
MSLPSVGINVSSTLKPAKLDNLAITLSNQAEAVLLDIATDINAPATTIRTPTIGLRVATKNNVCIALLNVFTAVATNVHIEPILVTVHKNINALDTVLAINKEIRAAARILIAGLAFITPDTITEIHLTKLAISGTATPIARTNTVPTICITGLKALYSMPKLAPIDLKPATIALIAVCSSGGTKSSNNPPRPLFVITSRALSSVLYMPLTILFKAL